MGDRIKKILPFDSTFENVLFCILYVTLLPVMNVLAVIISYMNENSIRKTMGITWKEYHKKQDEAEQARLKSEIPLK